MIKKPKPAPKPKPRKSVTCPTCGRIHVEHQEFGQFCCQSCVQTAIRPLITVPYFAQRFAATRKLCPICGDGHFRKDLGPYCSGHCYEIGRRQRGQLGGMPDAEM